MRYILDLLFQSQDNPIYARIMRWVWIVTLAGIAGIIMVFVGLAFTDLPSIEQLENPKSEEASLIYGADGSSIGRYYTENRVPVTYKDLDPDLVNALIATEDERYYRHSGIDFQALGRVAVKTILLGQESSGGASTITQQLAKQLFTKQVASNKWERVIQKLKEWIISVRLERRYTKEEIIAMYLNKFNFIYAAYGIKAASEIYFDTSQDSLSVPEAAMLVGMLKNPTLYNPLRFPEKAMQRRAVVLKQMQRNQLIDEAAYDSLHTAPLGVKYSPKTHIDGIATYFRAELAKEVKDILAKKENLKSDGAPYDIYKDGLKIYTTIDPDMQRMAEETMLDHMEEVQKRFNYEWRRADPWTYKSSSEKEIPLEVRRQTLNRLVRESQRYKDLRIRYLSDLLATIENEVGGINFHEDDREVVRMLREYNQPGYLDGLVSQGYLSRRDANKYRQIINSSYFPRLQTQWEALQDERRRVFNAPVEMTVFAYNDQLETDTVMTPLDSIKYHRNFLQTGILAVDPVTGEVKVWIGGINHKYFQYDHVRTNRQVGSTFKPFIYATAINQLGFSPCYRVYDLPQTIAPGDGSFGLQEEWTPRNFDDQYSGRLLTLKQGLAKSKNTVSVRLMKEIGDTEPVRSLLHNMGIDSSERYPNGRFRVPRAPSICLGSTDLTVMEMTGAYTTFANNGLFNKPVFIKRIEDKNGRSIFEQAPQDRKALPQEVNYVMVEMLRYAKGSGFANLESDIGGKTGTTNDFVDGWFMGITPSLVVGTWVGGEDRWIRFLSSYNGQGARMARPFFQAFLRKLENDPEMGYNKEARFYRPPGDLGIELDCSEYERAGQEMPLEQDTFEEDPFSEDMFGDEAMQQDTINSLQDPSTRN